MKKDGKDPSAYENAHADLGKVSWGPALHDDGCQYVEREGGCWQIENVDLDCKVGVKKCSC